MRVKKWSNIEAKIVDQNPYKGKQLPVTGVSVQTIHTFGDAGSGKPDFGSRIFNLEPKADLPIHKHYYYQIMHVIEGQIEFVAYDEDDKVKKTKICSKGTTISVESMEPHSCRNTSKKNKARFICCVCNLYENEGEF